MLFNELITFEYFHMVLVDELWGSDCDLVGLVRD